MRSKEGGLQVRFGYTDEYSIPVTGAGHRRLHVSRAPRKAANRIRVHEYPNREQREPRKE
jgi:hypothetical protein